MLPIAIVLIVLSVALFIVIKSKTAKLILSTLIVVVGVVFMHFGYEDYQSRQGGQVASNQEQVQGESTDEDSQDEKSSEKEGDQDEDKEDNKDSNQSSKNQSSKSESNYQSSTDTSVDSLKPKYLQRLNNIQKKVDNIYYGDSTVEMKQAEGEAWQLWDDALNEIYGVLKTQLSTSEMDALRTKQRAWITYRDNTAESESSEFKGGTMESLVYVSTRASLTKERCYELVNIYMK